MKPLAPPNPDLPIWQPEPPKSNEGHCERCGEKYRHLAWCPSYVAPIPRRPPSQPPEDEGNARIWYAWREALARAWGL